MDKYQTVAFDCNWYSVPRPFAFPMVTVKGFIDRVVIVAAGQVIATHARSLQRGTLILDPIHYLAALSRKPGAVDHTPVYRDWKLPACFAAFRADLEAHHGARPAHGASCGSGNSWASIPWTACGVRLRPVSSIT